MTKPMKAHALPVDWQAEHPFEPFAEYLDSEVWAGDVKLDGTRASLEMGAERNRFAGHRGAIFPQFANAVIPELAGTVLDGEFLADGAKLGQVAGLFNSGARHAAEVLGRHPAQFVAFDVTAVCGQDVTGHTWEDRRHHLAIIVAWINQYHPDAGISLVPEIDLTPKAILGVIAAGGEGIMLKRRASTYQAGKRSRDWLKIKARFTFDVVITGWRKGGGYNRGKVGSVEVSVYFPDGELCRVAHVGLKPAQREAMTAPDGSLRPEYYGRVAEIAGHGVTAHKVINLPIMVKLRDDKPPEACTSDQLEDALQV